MRRLLPVLFTAIQARLVIVEVVVLHQLGRDLAEGQQLFKALGAEAQLVEFGKPIHVELGLLPEEFSPLLHEFLQEPLHLVHVDTLQLWGTNV